MKWPYYREHIDRRVPGDKVDLTPLCNDAEVWRHLILDLSRPFRDVDFDKVASPEALGFILGSAVAQRLGKGFIPVRKGDKLPIFKRHKSITSFVDFSNTRKTLEVNRCLVEPGDRILIVDDVIDSGAQMKAMILLMERLGATVVGASVLVADVTRKTKKVIKQYNIHAVHMPIVSS